MNRISWKQLDGRRSIHQLHAHMFSDCGLTKILEFRPRPHEDALPISTYSVCFDRSYVVDKLAYELEECGDIPFLDLVEVLLEAYTIVNPTAPIVGIMPAIRNAVKVDELFRALGGERHYQEFGEG
jgi:hypothetical protein